MRYLCVHCDYRFEHEGDDKPRCPKCMRRHGLERIDDGKAGKGLSKSVLWGGLAVLAVLVGGGYAWWSYATPGGVSGKVPLAPLDRGDVRDWLAHDGVEAGDMAALLRPDDAVEAFADKATKGAGSATQKAKKIVAAIDARADHKAFVPWTTSHPRQAPVRTAAKTLAALKKDGARHHLYPLEVAALAVAALRSVDVPAMLVEAWKFPGDRSPPDPSGHFGYYLVGVWPSGEPNAKTAPRLFDPYGSRGNEPPRDGYRVLDDVQAIGAALTHEAAEALGNDGDTSRALTLVEGAVKLDPRSPQAHTMRGEVLLETGGPEEGAKEIEAAAQLRDDAPRRKNVAAVLLAKGQLDDASRRIGQALDQYPDYADAHAMVAMLHLVKHEDDAAKTEIETAERLDPNLPNLSQIWAQYYLAEGDVDQAVARAQEAVKKRPHDWQTRLQAARIFLAANRYDDMRRQARAILAMVPDARKEQMRGLIQQVLGPTAFAKPADEVLAGSGGSGSTPDTLPSPGQLQLDKGSTLLGSGSSDKKGPSTVDLGGNGSGPLLLGGDASKLKLRAPGEKLHLDLHQ